MKQINFSFEFFPPKNRQMSRSLWHSIEKLSLLNPSFVSVTYGAGGSTRERTHKTIRKILKNTNLLPAPHLTCIGSSKEEIIKIAKRYKRMGIKHIVALRGDLPIAYDSKADSYNHADQLVASLKQIADFEITVAGYPEKHPEAKNIEEDIDNLKRKIDAGASRIITQFFFDNNKFYEYLNLLRKKGINIPVVPGILPIMNFNQILKFSASCGSTIPSYFHQIFDEKFVDPSSRNLAASFILIKQCQDLIKNDIENFHFYTLNRADLVSATCHILQIEQS